MSSESSISLKKQDIRLGHTSIYRKNVVFCRNPVRGFYRFSDIFQIYSVPVIAPQPPYSLYADYPFILECKLSNIELEMIYLGSQAPKVKELLALLTVFTRGHFLSYDSVSMAWYEAINEEGAAGKSQLGFRSYNTKTIDFNITEFSPIQGSFIEQISAQDYFSQHAGDAPAVPLTFPDNIDALFTNYFSLPEEARKAFHASLLLFYESLSASLESVKIALLVSSIESLVNYNHRNVQKDPCEECGQIAHQTTKKFKDFVHEYSLSQTRENQKYVRAFYDARCKILHAGGLFMIDTDGVFVAWKKETV